MAVSASPYRSLGTAPCHPHHTFCTSYRGSHPYRRRRGTSPIRCYFERTEAVRPQNCCTDCKPSILPCRSPWFSRHLPSVPYCGICRCIHHPTNQTAHYPPLRGTTSTQNIPITRPCCLAQFLGKFPSQTTYPGNFSPRCSPPVARGPTSVALPPTP